MLFKSVITRNSFVDSVPFLNVATQRRFLTGVSDDILIIVACFKLYTTLQNMQPYFVYV